jgi:Ni/Co efflux regulator RcnB
MLSRSRILSLICALAALFCAATMLSATAASGASHASKGHAQKKHKRDKKGHKKKHKKKKHKKKATSKNKPAQAPAEPTTALLRGVTISNYTSEAEVDHEVSEAKALHAQVVRINLSWASLQPDGPGTLAPGPLAAVDSVINAASAAGLKVVAVVQSSPCWASSAPAAEELECVAGKASTASAWPPSNPSYYGDFVAELAHRYGNALAAIEVWNEPDYNGENYLAGPDKAEEYARILKAAYPAIKSADPNIAVLAGALVGSNGVFLRDLYAEGIQGYYDGLAVHYYTLTISALRGIHEAQLQAGDNKPLWLDEFGFPSCTPGQTEFSEQAEQACVTPQLQALNVANIVHLVVRLPYVAAAILYKMRDTVGNEFGVLTASGARKPSFDALASAFATPFAQPSPVILHLGPESNGIVAFGSGPVGSVMELEAFKDGHMLYGQTFTLNTSNAFSTRLPVSLGTTGVTVRLYPFGTTPSTAAQLTI